MTDSGASDRQGNGVIWELIGDERAINHVQLEEIFPRKTTGLDVEVV